MIFGKPPISPEELVTTLNRRASSKAKERDPLERNTAWTYAVMEALDELAHERGFRQIVRPQFILDAVWWQEKPGNAAVLGVESEWGNPRDRDCERHAACTATDFEKLLQFKAPMKVMLFTADNAQMRAAIHKILLEYLRTFQQHVAREMYVFVEFSRGNCYSYTCKIKKDGRDASLALSALNTESAQILET